MGKIHIHLSKKYSWYNSWHQHPYHSHMHWLVFVMVIGLSTIGLLANMEGWITESSFAATTSDHGLSVIYYNNKDFTGSTVSRVDPRVNFNWGYGSPSSKIGSNSFSARWTGQVEAQYTGTYTFYTDTDDGVKLWVNDQLLVDKWVGQKETTWSGNISLVSGNRYNIKMEYFEDKGKAVAKLL